MNNTESEVIQNNQNEEISTNNNKWLTAPEGFVIAPTGEQINVFAEFPVEDIRTYKDYLYVKENLKILEKNMNAEGMFCPPGYILHRIVPLTSRLAQEARDVFKKNNVDVNCYQNGIFMPKESWQRMFGIVPQSNTSTGNGMSFVKASDKS